MKKILYSILILHLFFSASAQESTVFKSGDEGYVCFRIPATIASKSGQILAFAEGRVKNCGDFGNVDIVTKSSSDGGKTWSALKVVADNGNLQAGNPAPVFDYLDERYPNGRLFLFYNTGNNSEGEIVKGNGVREVWYITSLDFGQTWSEPTNITVQVHKPNEPSFDPTYNFKEDWRHYANTPGHAIQLKNGNLFIPMNFSLSDPKEGKIPYFAGAFYSEDHGENYRLSAPLSLKGSNESTAVQLANGDVLMNARDQTEQTGKRYFARSKDNGITWYEQGIDKQLTDPVCEGSLNKIGKRSILLSHLDSEKGRKNLVLRVSKDGGKIWNQKISIYTGSAAYSDIVVLSKKKVGVLYEKDEYSKIAFKVVNVN
ncbi:sialidase-1 [Spirosomataceae bacterium TFI 002]|nr:sialidase-1 [Spirosomataceae bacterium TFI 002]